jgi:hypothetical protein
MGSCLIKARVADSYEVQVVFTGEPGEGLAAWSILSFVAMSAEFRGL